MQKNCFNKFDGLSKPHCGLELSWEGRQRPDMGWVLISDVTETIITLLYNFYQPAAQRRLGLIDRPVFIHGWCVEAKLLRSCLLCMCWADGVKVSRFVYLLFRENLQRLTKGLRYEKKVGRLWGLVGSSKNPAGVRYFPLISLPH